MDKEHPAVEDLMEMHVLKAPTLCFMNEREKLVVSSDSDRLSSLLQIWVTPPSLHSCALISVFTLPPQY